jgi:hypothetical protein
MVGAEILRIVFQFFGRQYGERAQKRKSTQLISLPKKTWRAVGIDGSEKFVSLFFNFRGEEKGMRGPLGSWRTVGGLASGYGVFRLVCDLATEHKETLCMQQLKQ